MKDLLIGGLASLRVCIVILGTIMNWLRPLYGLTLTVDLN